MYAIVTVEKPENRIQQTAGAWPSFLSDIQSGPLVGSQTRPSETVWLFPIPAETAGLALVVQAAQSCGLAYRVLYFEKPPEEFKSAARAL